MAVIGIDPGLTTGIVILSWGTQAGTWPPDDVSSYQCDAANAGTLLAWLLTRQISGGYRVRAAIEEFREGVRSTRTRNPQDAKVTRALAITLGTVVRDRVGLVSIRPASTVKTWATDRRMKEAGIWPKVPVKMIDARSAAQQACFEATATGWLPDPLSRKSMKGKTNESLG